MGFVCAFQKFDTPLLSRWSIRCIEIDWTNSAMVMSRVMFGRVVTQVMVTRFPLDVKLFLFIVVGEPVEMHVNGFGLTLFHGTMGDSTGSDIISGEGGWGLRMVKVKAAVADENGLTFIEEEAANFDLSSG